MKDSQDWLWDVIACPECGSILKPDEDEHGIVCVNEKCGYRSRRDGPVFNLLPLELDRFQIAEHNYRVDTIERYARPVGWMNATQYSTLKLLNVLTHYSFTSQYLFFRDFFVKKYHLEGLGLEIGGAIGHQSGFIRLFYPGTAMVTSDVAPINVTLAEEVAKLLHFDTDYFVMADAERLPFQPGSFDFVFGSGTLHHLGDIRRALQEVHEVLKPGGLWYVVNELSIGSIFRLFWDSRWGAKGRWAAAKGIRERSYTLREWETFFQEQNFKIVEMHFYRNPKHKLMNWSRATYYALISKLPLAVLKMGVPCEIDFVLERI